MNIKCNADICKNYANGKCKLGEITLRFDSDCEAYGCYCSNFMESKEHKKTTYKLNKLDKDLYLATRTGVFNDVDLEMVIEEINPKENIKIIIDNLLYVGSPKADNRFVTVIYDGNIKNLYKNYSVDRPLDKYIDEIKRNTCNYIRETGREGCIYSTAFRMIMKGIDL